MTGYQRFVAYVYEYQKEKKGNNCGFMKVEVRNGLCSMALHLQCPGLMPQVTCSIYGFVRNSGLMDGYFLGSCQTQKDTAECVIRTDAENMGGSGIPLEKLGGMILKTENGAFFGTEWDDQPIRPGNFREIIRQEKGKERETSENQELSSAPEHRDTEKNPENDSRKTVETPRANLENAAENMEDATENTEEIMVRDTENPEENAEKKPDNINEQKTETQQDNISELQCEEISGKIPEGISEEIIETAETPEISEDLQREHSEELRGASSENNENMPEAAARYEPFEDGEIIQCRKIHPQDFRYFQRRDGVLRNNRFLMYGYYNFGHLLLGKKKSGHYILGVPGGYDQQERFMANMFGFPFFKESKDIELPNARGGYWYRLINPPNFCGRDGFH